MDEPRHCFPSDGCAVLCDLLLWHLAGGLNTGPTQAPPAEELEQAAKKRRGRRTKEK